MKQKFFNAAVVLVVLVLSLGLSNKVAAQSSDTKPVQTLNGASYMKTPDAGTSVYKNADGTMSTVNANGAVTLNYTDATGAQKVAVFVKPTVNTSVEMNETDMNQYITNYTKWMKANPDYKKFISATENSYIDEGDYQHLYKANYQVSLKQNMNK